LFPEYPIIDGMKVKARIKDVFERWKEDKPLDIIKAYQIDRDESDDFYV